MPGVDAQSLIPKPHADDPEDVAWALSTAEALWKRGEYSDAVSWIRKAATAASEAEADMRVIELAKAAAELANLVTTAHLSQPAPPMPSTVARGAVASIEIDLEMTGSAPAIDAPLTFASNEPSQAGRLPSTTNESSQAGQAPRAAQKPPGPPPRPKVLSAAPIGPAGHMLPTPNPSPSPLRPFSVRDFEVPFLDAPIEEHAVSPKSVRAVDSRGAEADDESFPRIPTVPPLPPDFTPTPMAMIAAPPYTSLDAIFGPKSEPPPATPRPTRGDARLITAVAIAPPVDVRSGSREATSNEPSGARPAPSDERSGARRAPTTPGGEDSGARPAPKLEASGPWPTPPRAAEERPSFASAIARVNDRGSGPAPRLNTLRSHPPPPTSTSSPPAAPASIGPAAPTPRRAPAMPPRPRSVRPPPPAQDLERPAGETSDGLGPAMVTETQQGLAPRVSETQKGVAAPEVKASPAIEATAKATPPPPRATVAQEAAGVARIAAVAPIAPKAPPRTTSGIDASRIEALVDVPDDARDLLLQAGHVVALLPEEVAPAPAVVIVLHGELEVRVPGYAATLEIVPADQMRILEPIAPARGELLVAGGKKGARYLSLPIEALDALRGAAPWVVQDLEPVCDDLHVVVGALRGEIGKRLDPSLVTAVLGRAETMRLAPGAVVVKQGELVRALVVLGAGTLSLRAGDATDAPEIASVEPGGILYPTELLSRAKAPSTVRAGGQGALVLVATRAATEELMVMYPPLLELLGDG